MFRLNPTKTRAARVMAITGLHSVGLLVLGIVSTAIVYFGEHGEYFSPLNHNISELGHPQISLLAWVYNTSLMASGVFFLIFCIALARFAQRKIINAIAFCGSAASVILVFVGLYPTHMQPEHDLIALAFFRLCLLTALAFSIFVIFDKERIFPTTLVAPGILAAVTVVTYVGPIMYFGLPRKMEPGIPHPPVFIASVLEWIMLAALLGWISGLSLYALRLTSRRAQVVVRGAVRSRLRAEQG